MKKFRFFSFASAMLLASAAGMVSCSSDSIEPTGGSGVAGQVVKTQFYINIPYKGDNGSVSTRMTDVNTQNTGNNSTYFLGMVYTQMYAFKGEPGTSNTTSVKAITIGNAAEAASNDKWRNVYRDIAIPVGTKNLLLYARADKKAKNYFQAGYLSNPYASTTADATELSALNFALTEVNKDVDFSTEGAEILDALNLVANTSVTKPGTTTNVKWSEIDNIDNSDLGTENERLALKERYKKFITLTSGSAKSVQLLIENLKKVINGSNGVEDDKLMANAIVTNCKTALSNLENKDFPRNLNLPDGVAKVIWNDASKKFEYLSVNSTGSTGNLINYTTITYPSELAYYVSSPVRVSNNEITAVTDLPEYDKWIGNTADWTGYGDAVESSTRFVALQKPVLYGVACLKSTVKCASNTLIDNAKDKGQYESDNSITVNNTSFPITGILIGGQPKQVAWNFEAANTVTTNEFKYTIYDCDMNKGENLTAAVTGTAEPEPNYTLVLDNKDNSATSQNKVYITIELENKAGDFFGADGLIPTGSKFYMVGELDPKATSGINQPTGETLDHVFVKDHTTIANFTIKNLKKAYNHIPDMRSSKINVGLAVDLDWKTGITFDVDI